MIVAHPFSTASSLKYYFYDANNTLLRVHLLSIKILFLNSKMKFLDLFDVESRGEQFQVQGIKSEMNETLWRCLLTPFKHYYELTRHE